MKRTLSLIVLIIIAAFVGCGDNNNNNNTGGGAPTIVSVTPSEVSIGQKSGEGVISGTNLNGVTFVGFGDGVAVDSFTGKSANEIDFTFTVAGNITGGPKTVTVTTPAGTVTNSSVFQVVNNHAPKAAYTVDPPSGSLTTVFNFDGSTSTDQDGSISSWKWDFGDGKSGQGKKVTHKYAAVGKYSAVLTVSDSHQATSTASRDVQVAKNSPPVAKFTIDPGTSGSTGTTFVFDASRSTDSDGKVKDWLWEFGDGTKARGKETVEHQYKNPGSYDVSLTVFDNIGQASEPAAAKIKVEKGPQEQACAGNGGNHANIIKGRVVAVESGNWAITAFGAGHNCSNTWHKCDDFRKLRPEGFYGIVDKMTDRGNGVMGVHNSCPYRWPPSVGEEVFIYFKTCQQNHCP